MEILRRGKKKAVRFETPSGVTAVVATSLSPELMGALKRKLEGKLRRSGHLGPKSQAVGKKAATNV